MRIDKLELAVDSQAACISKLADEIRELQKKQDVQATETFDMGEEVRKGVEEKWDEGISRIMNYDPMRR